MSLSKGKRFEREVAAKLSEWSGIELVRTPDGTPEEIYGDIWPKHTTDYFPLSVECKCVEGWSFDQIVRGIGPMFTGSEASPSWIEQAVRQAMTATRELGWLYKPMLVFSKNRFPTYMVLSLGNMPMGPYIPSWIGPWNILSGISKFRTGLIVRIRDDDSAVWFVGIIEFEHFLKRVPYEAVVQTCTNTYWCP